MNLYVFVIPEKRITETGILVIAERNYEAAKKAANNLKYGDVFRMTQLYTDPEKDEVFKGRFFFNKPLEFHESEDTVPYPKGNSRDIYIHWMLREVIKDIHWCDDPDDAMKHRHLKCMHEGRRGIIAATYNEG